MLHHAGIESVVIERQSREHVLSRIRAGVLEWGTVEVLRANGLGDADGRRGPRPHRDRHRLRRRAPLLLRHRPLRPHPVHGVRPDDDPGGSLQRRRPARAARSCSRSTTSPCATSPATAPGGHVHARRRSRSASTASSSSVATASTGPAKSAIPASVLRTYEKSYPFGWLGILSETPPLEHLVYCNSPRGFALASQRNPMLSRYYVQCPLDDTVDDWPDSRFWDELLARYPRSGVVADRHRPVDREVDRSAAQLRRRADALRQPVARRRRRPHRAADRRQGPQPRRVRRVLPVARTRASTTTSATTTTSTATPRWRCGGCGRRSASRGG